MKTKIIVAFLFALSILISAPAKAQAGELHDAALIGNLAGVRQLLDKGGDVNAKNNNGKTPLHLAARSESNQYVEVVTLLIQKGADVNARDEYLDTPLHAAAYNGSVKVAVLLIQKGADVNARNNSQQTPLHRAVDGSAVDGNRRTEEVAALLIQNGAEVNAKQSHEETPLHTAAYNGSVKFAALLIQKGADVNARNMFQETPLHCAAEKGKVEVAVLLIQKGAVVTLTGGKIKLTPAETAERNNHPELAAMLRKGGDRSPRQDFDTMVQMVAKDRQVSVADLRAIVRLARSITPSPVVSEEARDEMIKGQAAFKLAKRPADFAQAVEYYKKASLLAPWWPNPYFNMALAQEKLALAPDQQKSFRDAKTSLEMYLIAAPDAKDTGAVKQKMAELDLTMKRWDEYAYEVNAGSESYNKDRYSEAIRHWREALQIYPDHPNIDDVYFNIGEAYRNLNDLNEAYKYMQKAIELRPERHSYQYTQMGVVLERRGDQAKACTYYRKGCDAGSQVSCSNLRNCR